MSEYLYPTLLRDIICMWPNLDAVLANSKGNFIVLMLIKVAFHTYEIHTSKANNWYGTVWLSVEEACINLGSSYSSDSSYYYSHIYTCSHEFYVRVDWAERSSRESAHDIVIHDINGLVKDCIKSSALAMELLQSCAKPSISSWIKIP